MFLMDRPGGVEAPTFACPKNLRVRDARSRPAPRRLTIAAMMWNALLLLPLAAYP
jgi:hypothetical protein